MSEEEFTEFLQTIKKTGEQAVKRWNEWAETLAGYEQERGGTEKTADWFRSLFMNKIKEAQVKHGDAVAGELIALAEHGACPFPWEIACAAEHLAAGDTVEDILRMEEDGLLDEPDSGTQTGQIPPV